MMDESAARTGVRFSPPVAEAARAAGRTASRLTTGRGLFLLVVALPTFLTAIYYLLIAAPIYVSEARFVVRTRSQGQPSAVGSVLQSVGVDLGSGATDAFEVHEYLTSRDAAAQLDQGHRLRAMLGRPEGDFIARFPRPFETPSFENLYRAYGRFVTVGYDSQTGISTLRVAAFRPKDAQNAAEALLAGGEGLVNRLNDRAAEDSVAEARREVEEAQTRTADAEMELTRFRNREQLIDPTHSSLADLDLIGKLDYQIATQRAERATLASSAPQSPELPILDKRIQAFEAQADAERARIAGANNSLAPKIGEYERLMLERDFAAKTLASASAAMETARVEARRKQLYLERVVSPNLPDKAVRPQRWRAILIVLVSSLLAYGTIALVAAGLREHRQR